MESLVFFSGAESLKSPPMKFQQSKTILVHFSPSLLAPSSLLAPPSQHQVTNPLHPSLPAPPAAPLHRPLPPHAPPAPTQTPAAGAAEPPSAPGRSSLTQSCTGCVGMAPCGRGGGAPPSPRISISLKSASDGMMRWHHSSKGWKHTRKGTNSTSRESSVPAQEGRQFADERAVSLSYMWEVAL